MCIGAARLAVVHREGAEQRVVGREDRRRPARAQAGLPGELAEVGPQRIRSRCRRPRPARGDTRRCRRSRPKGRSRPRRSPPGSRSGRLGAAPWRRWAPSESSSSTEASTSDDCSSTKRVTRSRSSVRGVPSATSASRRAWPAESVSERLPVADVTRDRRDGDQLARGVEDPRDRGLDVDPNAVLANPNRLERRERVPTAAASR